MGDNAPIKDPVQEQFDRDLDMLQLIPESQKYRAPIVAGTSRSSINYELDGDERVLIIEETVEAKKVTEIEYDPDETTPEEIIEDYKEESSDEKMKQFSSDYIIYISVMLILILMSIVIIKLINKRKRRNLEMYNTTYLNNR